MSMLGFQYAEALFEISNESDVANNIQGDFQSFLTSIDEEVMKFLKHPKISKKAKKDVMETVISNELLKHFVFVLIDNNRVELMQDVYDEFTVILNQQNKLMLVTVYSKQALSKTQQDDLINSLSKKHNRKIELKNVVDQTIVGGLRIEYEGYVLDDTINNYLGNLKANLIR
jgi:F-type H+-transporting ATPase subunit delta